MDAPTIAAAFLAVLLPTAAQLWWEYYQANATRQYVDRRVKESEARAQKDRDNILSEAKFGRERVEQLIAALQAPPPQAPAESPGFAHGVVDPVEAVNAREEKKRERKEKRLMNASLIAEALGERAPFAKGILKQVGYEWNDVLDMDNVEMVVGALKRIAGKGGGPSNGHGHVDVARYI